MTSDTAQLAGRRFIERALVSKHIKYLERRGKIALDKNKYNEPPRGKPRGI
jgi:DNA-binding MarR family transcriptional regulator